MHRLPRKLELRVATPIVSPMVTGSPFFSTFFLSPISVSFAEKVNPRWLQLNLFFVAPTCHHNLLCWESLIILWCQDNYPSAYPPFHTISTAMSSPPSPRPPVAAETPAILVVWVYYILPLKQGALLPPDAKRTAKMCCCLHQI